MKNISIAGGIGKDAEVRTTQGGDNVTGFSVAVDDRRGSEKSTIWFDVSIWGKRGDALAQYLTKGTRVAVAGELGTREHNGKTYLTVKADQVTLLGGGQRSDDSGYGAARQEPAQSQGYGGGDMPDDEIPW